MGDGSAIRWFRWCAQNSRKEQPDGRTQFQFWLSGIDTSMVSRICQELDAAVTAFCLDRWREPFRLDIGASEDGAFTQEAPDRLSALLVERGLRGIELAISDAQ